MSIEPELVPITAIICMTIALLGVVTAVYNYNITELNYICTKKEIK